MPEIEIKLKDGTGNSKTFSQLAFPSKKIKSCRITNPQKGMWNINFKKDSETIKELQRVPPNSTQDVGITAYGSTFVEVNVIEGGMNAGLTLSIDF